jgi:hypothetical protein
MASDVMAAPDAALVFLQQHAGGLERVRASWL